MSLVPHIIVALLLLLGHGFFFFRGLALRRRGDAPKRVDKIARAVSHFALPAAIITGFLINGETRPVSNRSEFIRSLHLALGLLPIIAILAFTPFLSLRRRIPWLLPALNLLLIAVATVTGFILIGARVISG